LWLYFDYKYDLVGRVLSVQLALDVSFVGTWCTMAQGVLVVALDATLHLNVLVYLVIVLGVLLGTWCTSHVKVLQLV